MKKLLSLLAITTVLGSSSISVISCASESSTERTKVDISGKKFTTVKADTAKLAYSEIRKQIGSWASPPIINDEVKNDMNIGITLMNSDGSKTILEDDTKLITGSYEIRLNTNNDDIYFNKLNSEDYKIIIDSISSDINTIIKTTNLGPITMTGTMPTEEELNAGILAVNKDYNKEFAKLTNITSTGANVIGNGTNYIGDTAVTFTKKFDIHEIIKTTDLGPITMADTVPTNTEVNVAILAVNKDYNKEFVILSNITSTGANVTGDGTNYTGSVTVKFTKKFDIHEIIKTTDLGPITMADTVPTEEELNAGILAANKDYNKEFAKLTNITSTGANVTGDGINYIGDTAVTFTKKFDIHEIITTTNLGPITMADSKPTSIEVNGAILAANKDYNKEFATLCDVSATQATVNGDGINYTGSVTVSFTRLIIKANISSKKFSDKSISEPATNASVYSEVRKQIASWATPSITEADIKSSDSILISVWVGAFPVGDNTSSELSFGEHNYNVLININPNNPWFTSMNWKMYCNFKVDIN